MKQTASRATLWIKNLYTDKKARAAAAAALLTGLLAYGYGMSNSISNYDSIYNNPGIGVGGLRSGRWMLDLLTRLTERLGWRGNLPWFNIGFSLLLLALVCVLLCRLFRLPDRRACVLLSAVTVAFPAVASMSFFSFTMPYYALALLLIAGGFLLAERGRSLLRFPLLALLLALAAGIYQAYYPFALVLAVLLLILDCLEPAVKPGQILRKGLAYVLTVLGSYLLYRLLLALCLSLADTSLIRYQGIDEMGRLELSRLPELLKQIGAHFYLLPFGSYMSLAPNLPAKLLLLPLLPGSLLLLLFLWREKNLWKRLELAGLLLLALPLAADFIVLMVPRGTTYTLMALGLVSLFYLPLLLVYRLPFPKAGAKRAAVGLLTAVLLLSAFNYAHLSNGCWQALEWSNRQTENYYTTLFTRIKAAPGYRAEYPVLLSGSVITDPSYDNPWYDPAQRFGGVHQFDSKDPENNGFNEYSRERFIQMYLGYTARSLTSAEREQYAALLAEMQPYPNDDSIRVLDGVVLVKLQ